MKKTGSRAMTVTSPADIFRSQSTASPAAHLTMFVSEKKTPMTNRAVRPAVPTKSLIEP